MNRLLAVGLALSVLVGVLWITLRAPRAPMVPSDDRSTAGTELTAAPTPSATSTAGSDRSNVPTDVGITIVTKSADRPIAHTAVFVQKADVDPREWNDAVARYGSTAGALRHEMGDPHETDERGELRIPAIDRSRAVCAFRDELFGEATLAPDSKECAIEMHHARTLDIEVVDEQGTPVPQVCIAVLAIAGVECDAVGSAWTDRGGRVHVDDLDDLRWHDNAKWRIGPAYGGATPEFVDIDEHPPTPIRFVMGATADVELALVDSNGQPLAIDAEYGLYVDNERVDPPRALEPDSWHLRYTAGGLALFQHIALDLPLAVHVWATGFEFEQPTDLRGPTLPGERRRVELRCTSVRPVARGRVVDARGEPLRDWWLSSAGAFEDWTHDDGSFEAALDRAHPDLVGAELVLTASRPNQATRMAHVPVPPRIVPADVRSPPSYAFGTVVVEQLPLLVSGVVVDPEGRPVPGAQIDAIDLATNGGVEVQLRGSSCESDGQGRFVVAGLSSPASVDLCAHVYGGKSAHVTAAVGATDVRLVLDSGGRISGRLLLPDDLSIDDLELSFAGTAIEPNGKRLFPRGVETFPEGGFATASVESGRWSLAVLLGGATEPLARREDVIVDRGRTVDIGEIDVRAGFRPLAIAIVDEQGTPIQDARAVFFDSTGGVVGERKASATSHPTISVPLRASRACVKAPRHRTERFEELRNGAIWTMRKSLDVRLRWPPSAPRIESPQGLSVIVYPTDDSQVSQCTRSTRVDFEGPLVPGSEILIDLSGAGQWTALYSVRDERTGVSTDIDSKPRQKLDVLDADAPQIFTIDLDSEALSRVLALKH